MADFLRIRNIHVPVLIFILFTLALPSLSNALRPLNEADLTESSPSLVTKETDPSSDLHLQPINEKQLDDLSPSLLAPPAKTVHHQNVNQSNNHQFENSICFKRCHLKNDFHPSDNTAKQWRLLIEENGHAIFDEIDWENTEQKRNIVNYLIENARKSTPESAGIGVW